MIKITNCTIEGDRTIPPKDNDKIIVIFPPDQWEIVCKQPITLSNLIVMKRTEQEVDAMLGKIPLRG